MGLGPQSAALFQGTAEDAKTIILVLGHPRTLSWKAAKRKRGSSQQPSSSLLRAGGVLVMDGAFASHYQHGVLQEANIEAPHTRLVWRWIVSHRAPCPQHAGGPGQGPAAQATA